MPEETATIDWTEFGKRFGRYLITTVDETSFDAKDDNELLSMANKLTNPFSMEMELRKLSSVDEDFSTEYELLKTKSEVDKSILQSCAEGTVSVIIEKWPRLMSLYVMALG
jgi:hypothetical protein